MDRMSDFGTELNRLMQARGVGVRELGRRSGYSTGHISQLRRGLRNPSAETARDLDDALGADGALIAAASPVPGELAGGSVPPQPAAARAGGAWATRTLPRDIASFTGRDRQLRELLDAAAGQGGVVGIHAIGGMAGVGKTAFAVHAAHLLADRFPEGQVFLSLHGHTPGHRPADPAAALASLLLTIGVPARQIPPGLAARTALWRDRLAGQRLLLVLDDAADSEQVLPLLPGAGTSLVLITSRRHLSALDDATTISLDTLPPGEAAVLLARLVGRPALSPEDPAVGEIARLCGYLPLAIGMVARQLRHHPAWSPAGRAAELAAAADRLDLMATENLSVAAAFDLSYADLPQAQQRLFRLLGLHPGDEIDAYAAAALDGSDPDSARRSLEALYDNYLVTEPAAGRFRMHDLIRARARALTAILDPGAERNQATARLLDYYQLTASLAERLIADQTRPGAAPAGDAAPAALALADAEQALAWARAERATLLACLDQATAAGQHERVIALTAGLATLLRRDGPWAEAAARHVTAIAAARHLADQLSEANARHDLGEVQRRGGDYPSAAQELKQALDIYRDLGDRLGQANVLSSMGAARQLTGGYPAAAQALEQALDIYRDLGDRRGQANILCRLGSVRMATGGYPAAAKALDQALGIYRDIGDRGGEAEALNHRGTLHRVSGELAEAGECHRRCLDIARDIASPLDEARALAGLGRCAQAADGHAEAESLLWQALRILQRLGAAEAPGLLAELDALIGRSTLPGGR
jgi:tetratricopeptide (TPR) repeat protein/transcriptional regulator with XRE-family HTH domain